MWPMFPPKQIIFVSLNVSNPGNLLGGFGGWFLIRILPKAGLFFVALGFAGFFGR